MQNVSFIVYQQTVKKYRKFFGRYKKNVSTGRFQKQSIIHQNKIVRKLQRLYARMETMAMGLKLAMASSLAASMLMLTGTSAFSQGTLGPYTEVTAREDHPLPPPLMWKSSDQAYPSFADFDGDGDIDLLVTLDVDYYLGYGQKYDSTKFYEDVFDVEGRHINVAASNFFPDDALGDFSTRHMLEFADIDNDGDLDGFTTNNDFYSYEIKFLYNNNGTFEDHTGLADDPFSSIFPSNNERLAFVDLDADGDLDVFLRNGFYMNYGTSTQGDFQYYYHPYLNSRQHIAFFDIDADGDMDAILSDNLGYLHFHENYAGPPSPYLSVIAFNSSPNDLDPRFAELNGRDFGSEAIPKFADVDGDGDDDLLVMERSGSSNEIILFLNNGGTLNEALSTSNPFGGTSLYRPNPAWGDIDGDGDEDLFIGGSNTNILFFERQSSGLVGSKSGIENPLDIAGNLFTAAPQMIDIDGDNDLDAFIGQSSGNAIRFHENVGDATNWNFAADNQSQKLIVDVYAYTGDSYNYVKPAIADIDQDGDFDAFIKYYSNVYTFPNNGTNYVHDINIPGYYKTGIKLTDVDHDGDPDLIMGGIGSDEYFSFLTNSGGVFTAQIGTNNPFSITKDADQTHPSFIDFDNDGDLDIFMGVKYDNDFRYFTNTNPPPTTVLAVSSGVTWEEGDPPVQIISDGTITDSDGDLITEALVRISGFESGDQLNYTDIGPITGSWNAGTAELLLSGTDTPANYKTALQSITFENTSANPTNAARTIEAFVRDQDYTNPVAATRSLTVVLNTPPDVAATSTFTYGAGAGPVVLNNALTVTDVNDTDLLGATVTISNYAGAEDILNATAVAGITVSYASGVLTLSGLASIVDYQTVLQSATYENGSAFPTESIRSILFQVDDGIDVSAASTVSVNVVLDPPPVITVSGSSTLAFTENNGPSIVESSITISDNGTQLSSASVLIGNYVQGEDILSFTAAGSITGNFDTLTGRLSLTGPGTIAEFTSVLQSVSYDNTSDNPDITDRAIDFTVNDGISNSSAITTTVVITSVNDAPDINGNTGDLTHRSLTGAVIIDDQITVDDAEGDLITGALIQVATNYSANEDVLSFVDQGGISGLFNSVTGTLSLSGTATAAAYQSALRAVMFENTVSLATNNTKTITFQASDASDASTAFTKNVSVTPNQVLVSNIQATVEVGKSVTIDVIAQATIDPADVPTVSIITNPTQGVAVVNADQTITYTANDGANEVSDDEIGYEICNQYGVCGSETIEIDISNDPPDPPISTDLGPFITEPKGMVTIPLTLSDPNGNLDPSSLQLSMSPISGAPATIVNSELTIDYTLSNWTGVDVFEIEICDFSGLCVQQEIRLLVGELDKVNVFNGVSPNGDGINDFLKLQDIEFFKTNEVFIYNKVGQLIYNVNDYDNVDEVFTGVDKNGDNLPNGTYYFALFLTSANDISYKQSGFFLLSK